MVPLRYPLLLLALAAALAVALGVLLLHDRGAAGGGFTGSVPPTGIALPSFALRDQNGRVLTSADLRGKASVVTFLDTRCHESCPIVASLVARGLGLIPAGDRGRIESVAISVDPERDTTASVRTFLRQRGAAGSLRYLVGTRAELRPVWKRFSVLAVAPGGNANVHSAPVRIYDRHGTWVSTLEAGVDLTPANLAHDVRRALAS